MKKCPVCNNTTFYAIELMRAWAIVDGNGEIIEEAENIVENYIEKENWECTNCKHVVKN